MAVTSETLRLQAAVRALLAGVTDQHTRDLVKAWANAWADIEPELTAVLEDLATRGVRPGQVMKAERLKAVLAHLADELDRLTGHASSAITGRLRDLIDEIGRAQAAILASQLPPGQTLHQIREWSRVDPRQVNAIVARSTQQITSKLQPLAPQTEDLIRRELVKGVASGANPRKTARQMVRRVQKAYNGELGLTRALRVARTETLDAYRVAAHESRVLNRDLMTGWMWICELSPRSCPACIAEHGSIHPVDQIGPLDHVNGRCTGMPMTKSWGDLGYDIPEPPPIVPDAEKWFDRLTPAEQRGILGPSRFEAWKAGDYPRDQWSVLKDNPNWRKSIQISPVPTR